MSPVQIFEDRSMVVNPGHVVDARYVPLESITLGCKERMTIGDLKEAMDRLLSVAPSQPWPCPVGAWEGDRFVIHDGRHAYVAALMLGWSHLLVAWHYVANSHEDQA